jgi:regulator of nucleoside diphosphate kinase
MFLAPTSFHGRALDLPTPYLLEAEYDELADFVCSSARSTPGIALLWRELERAVIVRPDEQPPHRVHLHSYVRYTDLVHPDHHAAAQIVGPSERGMTGDPAFVSVLSLTGAALIGLQEGAVMPWLAGPDRLRIFRIDAVNDPPATSAERQAAEALERRRQLELLLSMN